MCVPIKIYFPSKLFLNDTKTKPALCDIFGGNATPVFIFEDIERLVDLLRSMLVGTLFKWSCIWGFTQCISISDFLMSVSFSL